MLLACECQSVEATRDTSAAFCLLDKPRLSVLGLGLACIFCKCTTENALSEVLVAFVLFAEDRSKPTEMEDEFQMPAYSGSRLLTPLAECTGLPLDQVNNKRDL